MGSSSSSSSSSSGSSNSSGNNRCVYGTLNESLLPKLKKLDIDLHEEGVYKIYRCKARFMSHESIVVGFKNRFFIIEIYPENGEIILSVAHIVTPNAEWESCGSTRTTYYELIRAAERVFKSNGEYSLLGNNCQHFANNFLSKIGLANQTRRPDTDIVLSMFTEYVPSDKSDYI